ncbi:GTP-binding protein 2-like [Biomphalaria glabrata]|uniref:GTP-binding protein 2-like n=1 Tax=Biomphalaria glabrata TaxID=6526 RepID=A0A9W2ZTY7_BIOGL|nr:GTP-binding protein 2-like [Biomphalaria glabrata]XP_055878487.1 GTP-binding protein 2-like [Biomphalaria glabrata]XP_055878488.1 GTP-binding protein 2-like [Biomphalaria glabrata]XP_055878489.1 GTP-binding protein 2-like [Biomphalaria glabrata]
MNEYLTDMFGSDDSFCEKEISRISYQNGQNVMEELPANLPPEEEEGNVEYKLKLVKPSDFRMEHLVTQMKWRLEEGQGEAIYEIGVEDNGFLTGLSDTEMDASLSTLKKMADRLGASIEVLREKVTEVGERKRAMEVLVRKVPDDQQFIDLKLAVLGNVDVGKSTILGVLTQGELDNGRGRARLNLFRHLHEIQTGRTSSISYEILGFDGNGQVVNYSACRSIEEICERSSKLITLIDLAGHHKYLKTTIFGLTGNCPDFAMLVVSANTGIAGTTKEHLGYALALKVPVFVVVNKIDMCRRAVLDRTLNQLEQILKSPGVKKVPFRIENSDDVLTAAGNLLANNITPIFTVSSVTGDNLDLLKQFLNILPPVTPSCEREKRVQDMTEFQIDELFSVPDVGTIVGGIIHRGSIREGDQLMLGPNDTGSYREVKVKTVHRNRLPCRLIQAGQAACVALMDVERKDIRKGMVLVSPQSPIVCCKEFEADIYVLFHSKSITKNFQTTIHIGTVRQTGTIIQIDRDHIKTNEKARVTFMFKYKPEHIRVGARLLFREGRSKGMGEVTRIIPFDEDIHR